MSVSKRHLLRQGPTIKALLMAVSTPLVKKYGGDDVSGPTAPLSTVVPPLAAALIDDFNQWCQADEGAYEAFMPPHLFSQWSFPLIEQSLRGLPWPMARILNQGCSLHQTQPLPRDLPLTVTVQRLSVTETATKAKIHTRVTTGTEDQPEMLVSELFAVVPLAKSTEKKKRALPTVPSTFIPIRSLKLPAGSGLDYALLTGDFNPIHWLKPAAKMAGFKSTILHGFGSFSLAWEALASHLYDGDPAAMGKVDVRFVRPLTLPNEVGVFLGPAEDGIRQIAVGLGLDQEAFMLGTLEVENV